jgi:hypothetical protein
MAKDRGQVPDLEVQHGAALSKGTLRRPFDGILNPCDSPRDTSRALVRPKVG